MAQNAPGGRGGAGRPSRFIGTDSRAQRYRSFSNVNQAFYAKQSGDRGLSAVDRATDITELQIAAKAGDNEVSIRLDRVPNGRIIMLDSCGFQYDIYLRADRWSFNVLRDGIIMVRFI